jgi:hypothetical protein
MTCHAVLIKTSCERFIKKAVWLKCVLRRQRFAEAARRFKESLIKLREPDEDTESRYNPDYIEIVSGSERNFVECKSHQDMMTRQENHCRRPCVFAGLKTRPQGLCTAIHRAWHE